MVQERSTGGRDFALVTVQARDVAGVYLRVRWPHGEQLLPVGMNDGFAALQLPADNGVPHVEVYPSPELRPDRLGCSSTP